MEDVMNSPNKLQDIYDDTSHLLYDICLFLNAELRNGALSVEAEKKAKNLVTRSQKQVATIVAISNKYADMNMTGDVVDYDETDYVETDVNNSDVDEENYNQVHIESSHQDLPNALPSVPVRTDEENCPYNDLSFNLLNNKAIKFGPLLRKERYFILEQKKQLFVGLVDYWLLIYPSEKRNVKPLQIIDLTEYKANALEQKKIPVFEITCCGKKSFEFIARSAKDREQWIVAINLKKKRNANMPSRNLPNIPTDNSDMRSSTLQPDIVSNFPINNGSIQDLLDNVSDTDSVIYADVDEITGELPKQSINFPFSSEELLPMPSLPPRKPILRDEKHNIFDSEISKYDNVNVALKEVAIEEEDVEYDEVQNAELLSEDIQVYNEPQDDEEMKFEEFGDHDLYDNGINKSDDMNTFTRKDNIMDVTRNKPEVLSPKPTIAKKFGRTKMQKQSETDLMSKADSFKNDNNKDSNRIHNIIQQMEASLSFSGKKN